MRCVPTLCFVLVCAAMAAGGARQPSADEQALIALERRWVDAFYSKDIDTLRELIADEFVSTYDDGSRGDKAKELKLAAEFDQQVTSAMPGDFSVKVYGNTGIVWFTLRVAGVRQGEPAELVFRYTDVWVRQAGRWQCVSSHITRVTARL
jgi:ketosteroid isomerase-like protein